MPIWPHRQDACATGRKISRLNRMPVLWSKILLREELMSRNGNHKLRIGIVGAGEIVKRRHLPAFKRRHDVEIVAVSNSTYESAEKFCQENVPSAVPIANWPDLVALPDIDVVWIGTPPYMHSAVTVSALEAGKHVFCQARMANDRAEAEGMLAAST